MHQLSFDANLGCIHGRTEMSTEFMSITELACRKAIVVTLFNGFIETIVGQ